MIVEPPGMAHSMGQVQVFGPKGRLLATRNTLFYRSARRSRETGLEGERFPSMHCREPGANPVAYLWTHPSR